MQNVNLDHNLTQNATFHEFVSSLYVQYYIWFSLLAGTPLNFVLVPKRKVIQQEGVW